MNKRLLVIILSITALLGGCGSLRSEHVQPDFIVTADVRSDPVPDITPNLLSQLSHQYAASSGHSQKDFIKVANELKLANGIVYLVRVKNGFCLEYAENQTGKLYLLQQASCNDESKSPGFPLGPVQTIKPLGKSIVFFATYNFPTATEVIYQWPGGQISRYNLVNGTVLLQRLDKQLPVKTQVIDKIGRMLFEGTEANLQTTVHMSKGVYPY